MSAIDYTIIFIYLGLMIGVGLYFQKIAGSGIDSYFLGNKKIPWWALGASGMASNLDVSGTMINTAFIYALGASGFFIEIRGGIVLTMAFFMIFMGKWNRRANVMTLAEWMVLRFGKGTEGKIARLICAIAILLSTVAIVSYFAIGGGKFIAHFLGIPEIFGLKPEFTASVIMIFLAMIYTVASGLQGVVWTDVFQGVLILATILIVCFISFSYFFLPESFDVSVPLSGGGYTSIPYSLEEWSNIWPSWSIDMPENSSYSIYNLFGITILFYLFKTFIEGSGGSGGYMAQRFFAARSDREAGLLSAFWIFTLSFRWPFIVAIAIMGIAYGVQNGVTIQDPETVLPFVINNMIPTGLKGLLVAGLMAAAMSTFDSIVNSGASYWVRDIYQVFINPKADEKKLVFQSRFSSVIIVLLGLIFTLNLSSINDIYGWITMGLGAGLIIPLLIRWYWWRLNGYGFAAGIAGGMITALVQKFYFGNIEEYYFFLTVSGVSLSSTIIVTFLTQPTPQTILLDFYKKTRPFGFWGPVKGNLDVKLSDNINKENRRDIISVIIAVPWQLVLFMTGMTLIMKRWDLFFILAAVLPILTILLYFNWFRHLSDEVKLE
ncbi:MAG: sodium:solute symporter [Melioribacteraceae bacterium]|nr:MAG: sodium:solute symporter [Melioribacteraceae bacterium]